MKTLNIIKNNESNPNLTIPEIFDTSRYSKFQGVTFSAGGSFIQKYFKDFESFDLILGIQEEKHQQALSASLDVINNLKANIAKQMADEPISFFQKLTIDIQKKFLNHNFELSVPIANTIHSKFYLLSSETENRLIVGSANLSDQAFNEHSNQFENILIFDNHPLFDEFQKYFDELKTTTTNYFPKSLESTLHKKVTKLESTDVIDKVVALTPSEIESLRGAQYIDTISDVNEKITLGLIPQEVVSQIKESTPDIKSEKEAMKEELKNEEVVLTLVKNAVTASKKPKFRQPATLKKVVTKAINIQQTQSVDEYVADRETLVTQPSIRTESNTGLLLEQKDHSLQMMGNPIDKDKLTEQLTVIDNFINNYRKFAIDYTDEYGSRIMEAILYSLTAPFLSELRKNFDQSEQYDIPQFLFIGGTAGSGKSSLVKVLMKMMGFYQRQQGYDYSTIIPPTVNNRKSNTIKQLSAWINSENVAPMFIDEISAYFFEKAEYGENLIVDSTNSAVDRQTTFPVFIGTTNSDEYSLPDRANRRSYYLKNDKRFNEEFRASSTEAFKAVLDAIDDSIFQDFIIKFVNKLMNPDTDWKHYGQSGTIDFLYHTREIFKEYYQMVGMPVPQYFPDSRYDDNNVSNKEKWRKLYEFHQERFKLSKDKNSVTFQVSTIDEFATNERYNNKKKSDNYRNALDPRVVIGTKDDDIIELKNPEFFDWIGVKAPKKTLFSMFK